MDYPSERINGSSNIYALSPPVNPRTGPPGSPSLPPFTTTEGTPLLAYHPIKSCSVTKQPSFQHPSTRQTIRPLSTGLNRWRKVKPRPLKQSIEAVVKAQSHLLNLKSTTGYG